MSRYVSTEDKRIEVWDPNTIVTVGWDNPMTTYFFQVHDPTVLDQMREEEDALDKFVEKGGNPDDFHFNFREGDDLVEWQGGDFKAILTIDDLVKRLEPYAKLSQDLLLQLINDKNS